MNAVKCPACGNLNSLNENFCMQCGAVLPQASQVSLSPEQHARAFGMNTANVFVDPQRGRKVWIWYCVYAVLMALMYAAVSGFGLLLMLVPPDASRRQDNDPVVIGTIYAIIGFVFFLPFAAALILPKKPWAWIYHIVLICLGLTSCCLIPFAIPLLINWLKPETKAYFGRS